MVYTWFQMVYYVSGCNHDCRGVKRRQLHLYNHHISLGIFYLYTTGLGPKYLLPVLVSSQIPIFHKVLIIPTFYLYTVYIKVQIHITHKKL